MQFTQYKRGDILLVDFGEGVGSVQGGIRPALVIQNDIGNLHSPTVLVAPMTGKQKSNLPTHITVPNGGGLAKPSTILFEQSRVIDKKIQTIKYIGHIEISHWMEVKILIAYGCMTFLGEKFRNVCCL